MSKLNKFLSYYLPPLAMAVLIFTFSSIPGKDYPEMALGGHDYSNITNSIAHIIEYALFGFLTLRAFDRAKSSRWFKLSLCLALLLLFAWSDEYHQSFVPGREVSLEDWLMDIVGILTGLGLYLKRENWPLSRKK
ncbi:MAG: VanZ family protein [bacterium]